MSTDSLHLTETWTYPSWTEQYIWPIYLLPQRDSILGNFHDIQEISRYMLLINNPSAFPESGTLITTINKTWYKVTIIASLSPNRLGGHQETALHQQIFHALSMLNSYVQRNRISEYVFTDIYYSTERSSTFSNGFKYTIRNGVPPLSLECGKCSVFDKSRKQMFEAPSRTTLAES